MPQIYILLKCAITAGTLRWLKRWIMCVDEEKVKVESGIWAYRDVMFALDLCLVAA